MTPPKTSSPITKWAEEPNKHFSKEERQRHKERRSVSHRRRRGKASPNPRRCHRPAVRMASSGAPQPADAGGGVEKREPLSAARGNAHGCSHCGEPC